MRDSGKGFSKWELQRGEGEEMGSGSGFFVFLNWVNIIIFLNKKKTNILLPIARGRALGVEMQMTIYCSLMVVTIHLRQLLFNMVD